MFHKTEQEIMKNWKGQISTPTVSIVCITYNQENYISEAINSFLMQETDFPFEIVIGEDCSTDGTKKVVEKYVEKYPKIIKFITSESNVGANQNFLRTVNHSSGNFIALCEGDDYWTDSKKLQIQIEEMEKYPEINLCFHLASTVDQYGHEKYPPVCNNTRLISIKKIIVADFHLIQTNTIVFKKCSLNNLNFDLLSQSPVGDVWIRLAAAIPNGAVCINKIMGTYRLQTESSWSRSIQNGEKFLEFVSAMLSSIDEFDKYWNNKYSKEFKVFKNMFLSSVMRKNIHAGAKNAFFIQYQNLFTISNFFKWHFFFKYNTFINLLRTIKYQFKRK